mgnify:FL=1
MQTEYQSIFERSEQKYLLQEAQYTALEQAMWPHMQPDSYGMTTIYSLYFDTPDYRLIRTSLEKPVYKEKLRLRCYGRPDSESTAFIELKKKYDGVVYKRRIEMPYEAAMQYLCGHLKLREMPQILQEVEWVRHFYGMLQPAMVLTYDRVAWFGRQEPTLRITFDRNIRWRTEQLELSRGAEGSMLLWEGQRLMEIKALRALPLWLVKAMGELAIYPVSYSKYGRAYEQMRGGRHTGEEQSAEEDL